MIGKVVEYGYKAFQNGIRENDHFGGNFEGGVCDPALGEGIFRADVD